jgi:hypothetical protein
VSFFSGSGATAVAHSTVVVGGQLAAYGATINVAQGVAYQGIVASLTDANTSEPAAQPGSMVGGIGASIDWGDGSAPQGQEILDGGQGNFTAWAYSNHAYMSTGTFNVTVTFFSGSGATAVAHSTVVVGEQLAAYGTSFNATQGVVYQGIVASLTDANTSEPAAQPGSMVGGIGASIDWGDGSAPQGQEILDGGQGNFTAWAYSNHVYTSSGTFNVTVTFFSGSGATAVAHSTARIP